MKDRIIYDGKSEILTIKNDSEIFIYNINSFNLTIVLEDTINCDVYYFNKLNVSNSITVNHGEYSKFNLYHSFNIDGEYNFTYRANMNGNSNVNNITITGVSSNMASLDIDGNVLNGTKENELNENIKILTVGGKAYVSPMIKVNCYDVIANHNTAISNIREDELFYLNSKGINKENAIKLITDGYIYGVFKNNEDFINIIK